MSSARIVELVKASAAAVEKGAVLHREKADFEKAAAAQSPAVIDALLAAKIIRPNEREKAAATLRNPVSMLKLVENMAAVMVKRATTAAMPNDNALRMGQPAAVKTASALSAFDKCGQAILGGQ